MAQRSKTTKDIEGGKLHILTRISLPPVHISLIDKPGEFPFGQHCVVEVEPGILPDVGLPDAKSFNKPVELLVTVMVLSGPESMSDPLQTVHNGAGKVVRWVDSGRKGKWE